MPGPARDGNARAGAPRYAVPVAGIGAFLSLWHIGVERLPGIPSGSCSIDVPCSLIYVERFGFVADGRTDNYEAFHRLAAFARHAARYSSRGSQTVT